MIRGAETLIGIDDDIQDDLRGSLDVQARLLYGLIHAWWIVTARGLQKMVCTSGLASEPSFPFIFFLLSRPPSLQNTKGRILVTAPASIANPNLFSLSA
jgi:hypothetical protein